MEISQSHRRLMPMMVAKNCRTTESLSRPFYQRTTFNGTTKICSCSCKRTYPPIYIFTALRIRSGVLWVQFFLRSERCILLCQWKAIPHTYRCASLHPGVIALINHFPILGNYLAGYTKKCLRKNRDKGIPNKTRLDLFLGLAIELKYMVCAPESFPLQTRVDIVLGSRATPPNRPLSFLSSKQIFQVASHKQKGEWCMEGCFQAAS